MDIVLCNECCWLGDSTMLTPMRDANVNPLIQQLVEKNDMCCLCCPNCGSSHLFHKVEGLDNLDVPVKLQEQAQVSEEEFEAEEFESVIIESDLQAEEEDDDILDEIFNSAEAVEKEPIERKARRPKPLLVKKCDECGKEFETKVDTNRCESCNEAFMDRFVNG